MYSWKRGQSPSQQNAQEPRRWNKAPRMEGELGEQEGGLSIWKANLQVLVLHKHISSSKLITSDYTSHDYGEEAGL